jgi:hypothetical protein
LIEAASDDFERDLIRSAHRDQPSDQAFRRALLGLGVGLSAMPAAVAGAAPVAAAVGSKLGAVVLAKWLVTGVALGVVTAGGVGLGQRVLARPSASTPKAVVANVAPKNEPMAAVLPKGEPARGSTVMTEPAVSEQAATPRPSVVRRPSEESAVSAPSEPPPPSNSADAVRAFAPEPTPGVAELRRETGLLDVARGALSRGDAASALATLERYEREFGHGVLAPEARVLEVRALLASGNRGAAETLARRVIDAAPASEHADAVRTLLGRSSNR